MAQSSVKHQHRTLLLKIIHKLTTTDLEELVFICEDVLSESTAEEIQSATSLFRALEHRGKLSPQDYNYLRECLTNIGRDDLASLLPENQTNKSLISLSGLSLNEINGSTLKSAAKKTMLYISNQLRKRDLDKMAYLCECEAKGGIDLIQTLERNGKISDGNHDYLSGVLTEIGRNDLGRLLKSA